MKRKGMISVKLVIAFSFFVTFFGITNKGFCEFFNPSKVTSSSPQTIQQAQSQQYGSKPTIAVMEFDNKAGVQSGNIGSGMKEQLVTALSQTNAFIILERQAIQDVLGEQDFGASGRVKTNTAPDIGEIEGASFLIYGAVTEYQANQAGAGAGVGGKIGLGLGVLGGLFKQAHVAIDIRVVDSRTGRVVNATLVEGKPKDLGGIGGIFGATLGGVVGAQYKTPIQKAVRACMIKAVNWIAGNLLGGSAHAGNQPVPTPSPPGPKQQSDNELVDRLMRLKRLKDKDLITEEEYKNRKQEIIKEY